MQGGKNGLGYRGYILGEATRTVGTTDVWCG